MTVSACGWQPAGFDLQQPSGLLHAGFLRIFALLSTVLLFLPQQPLLVMQEWGRQNPDLCVGPGLWNPVPNSVFFCQAVLLEDLYLGSLKLVGEMLRLCERFFVAGEGFFLLSCHP